MLSPGDTRYSCASTQTVTPNPRRVAMETYWREVQSIQEEKEGEEEEEEEERKSMDEVEVEEAWLTEAGLSSLVTEPSSSDAPPPDETPPAEALLSTLTRQQAATVRRRLNTYTETLRKRNRQPIRDVRDIFTAGDDSEDRSPASPPPSSEPPCRYHTTTKTIRRNTPSARPTLHTFQLNNQLPLDPSGPPTHTHSPTHTHPVARAQPETRVVSPAQRPADWLLRDCPYSEGVAEHKQGGDCWDCLQACGDDGNDLPFVPVSPSQGLSSPDDLSSDDLKRLGFICHIELATFLLAFGVQTKRTHPPRRRSPDSGVFGVPLTTLLENDRKMYPGTRVPLVFQKLLCFLKQGGLQTEGILRVPGSAARLKVLRKELDKNASGFDWTTLRQVDAAGLLKLFIRELPTPLLTHTHLTTYHAVLGVSSTAHQVQALQLLTMLLPESNRDTLRALLVFLREVVSHQDQNKMSLWNVSMVMAPNLFACHRGGGRHPVAGQHEEMAEAVGGARLVRLMIAHQDLLWTVPVFLLSQVRQMNQVSRGKQQGPIRLRRRLLWRRNDRNDRNQITELCEGLIRVHAPRHTKVSMAIQLDGHTTARDVTSHFECDNSQPVEHLYEVGGNICERRLHPDCLLLDVYRVNPRCDWLIKP